MSYAQFLVACVAGIVWAALGFPNPSAFTLGFLASHVIYNLINGREF